MEQNSAGIINGHHLFMKENIHEVYVYNVVDILDCYDILVCHNIYMRRRTSLSLVQGNGLSSVWYQAITLANED